MDTSSSSSTVVTDYVYSHNNEFASLKQRELSATTSSGYSDLFKTQSLVTPGPIFPMNDDPNMDSERIIMPMPRTASETVRFLQGNVVNMFTKGDGGPIYMNYIQETESSDYDDVVCEGMGKRPFDTANDWFFPRFISYGLLICLIICFFVAAS